MRLPVTKEQMEFLKTLGVEDKEYTEEEMEYIAEETVYNCLMAKGWRLDTPDYITNEIGDMCEDIITALTK